MMIIIKGFIVSSTPFQEFQPFPGPFRRSEVVIPSENMLNLATRTLFRRGKDGPFLKDMPELILWSVLSVLSAVSWAYPTGILLRFSAGAIFTVLVLFQMYRSFLIIKPSKSLRRSALTDAKQRAASRVRRGRALHAGQPWG